MNNDVMMAFDVILHAGNGKTLAMNAMDAAELNDMESAEKMIEDAKKEVNEAHLLHKSLLDKIANGQKVEVDLFLTHALDHLTSAEDMIIIAERFMNLYRKLEGGNKND